MINVPVNFKRVLFSVMTIGLITGSSNGFDIAPNNVDNLKDIEITTLTVDIGQTYVPDDKFEQALIALDYDAGPLDNYVPTANIENVLTLDVSDLGIVDLTGIEDFVSLQELNCSSNQLTEIPNFSNHPNFQNLNLNINDNYISPGFIELNLIGEDTYVFNDFKYSGQTNLVQEDTILFMEKGDFTLTNSQAGGLNTHYQWQEWDENGLVWADLQAETLEQYTFMPAPEHHGRKYRCEMTNDWIQGGVFYSDEYTISIFMGLLYAIADGEWDDPNIWSDQPNGDPINKYPQTNDIAHIDGYEVTVTNEVICKEVNIGSSSLGKLEISGSDAILTVNGEVKITATSVQGKKMLLVNNGGKIECN